MPTKSNAKKSTYPQTPFQQFTEAVDGLMRVPHSAIKTALDREKQEKAEKKRAKNQSASVSDRASDTED